MFNRVLAAVGVAALGAGVLIAPAQSVARGGAAGGFHPGFVRSHPFAPTHSLAPTPIVAPSHTVAPTHTVAPGFTRFPLRAAFAPHHRGFWYGGLPDASGIVGPLYGSYYDPLDDDY